MSIASLSLDVGYFVLRFVVEVELGWAASITSRSAAACWDYWAWQRCLAHLARQVFCLKISYQVLSLSSLRSMCDLLAETSSRWRSQYWQSHDHRAGILSVVRLSFKRPLPEQEACHVSLALHLCASRSSHRFDVCWQTVSYSSMELQDYALIVSDWASSPKSTTQLNSPHLQKRSSACWLECSCLAAACGWSPVC